MSGNPVNQQSSESSGKIRVSNRSAIFATLFTGVLALVLVLMFWIYSPSYVVLMQNLDSPTLARVTADLQKSNIAYQYDSQTGNILVPEKSLYQAKFALGSKGLEQDAMLRLMLEDENKNSNTRDNPKFPTKYFALETELARTISSIDNIEWARVHLAIDETGSASAVEKSRASVFVRLARGRSLGESQITSISHLIASSVANLSTQNVTIIDQSGNLLKSNQENASGSVAATRYNYARILEQSYVNKLEGVLVPIFGERSVRVRVDIDIEFKEAGQPSLPINQEQPSHIIRKALATVVVDNKLVNNNNGQLVSVSRTKQELERIEALVKQAIDYDEQRGDRVNVFNEPFRAVPDTVEINGLQLFSRENRPYLLKVALVALLGLLLAYYVLRYLVQKIIEMKPVNVVPELAAAGAVNAPSGKDKAEGVNDIENPGNDASNVLSAYESLLARTRQQVNDNPAHVAKVIKSWVRDNGR